MLKSVQICENNKDIIIDHFLDLGNYINIIKKFVLCTYKNFVYFVVF